MANKGVTQDQVNRAADALVTAGERPTVERIRAFLGSGSPNTVTRLLDGWWRDLGRRLATQQAKLALPDAPEAVVTLASQLWEQALGAARGDALAGVAADREALERDRTALAAEHDRIQQAMQAQQHAAETAQQALAVTDARLAEIQQLAEQQAQQIRDLTQQRDGLQTRGERLDAELLALAERLQQQEASATTEREAQALHLRATEDRAHSEIDRARQEAKDLRAQMSALARERTTSEQLLRQQREEAVATSTAAQREAAAQRARADALEQQLARLGDLPAAVQASLAQARPAKRPTRTTKTSAGKPKAPRRRAS